MKDSHYRISLDIHSTQSQVSLPVKQGDTSRKVFISLCEGGKPYQIEEGCFAVFSAKKPDKTDIENNCIIAGNVIEYAFTEQTTAASGILNCEIKLYGADSGLITCPRFTVIVDSRAVSDAEIESTSEYSALTNLYSTTIEAIANANGKAELAKTAADNADTKAALANKAADNANEVAKATEAVKNDVETKLANGEFKGEKGDKGDPADYNLVSNALKGTESGNPIRLDDVSPVEHTVRCNVRSKNLFNDLLDYKLGEGASYTYQDGVLTVEGQYANKYIPLTDGKTYTFSCKSTRTGENGGGVYIRAYDENLSAYVNLFAGSDILSPTATVTLPKGYPVFRASLYGNSVTGIGTATYTELMLEEGDTATEYVPYVDPTTVTVSRCGKNLIPYPYTAGTKTVNGVAFTDNGDGTITANGTASAIVYYWLFGTNTQGGSSHTIGAGQYCLSVSANGSSNSYYISFPIFSTSNQKLSTYTNYSGPTLISVDQNVCFSVCIVVQPGTTLNNVVFRPQLEVGSVPTAYESQVKVTTHTPNADGAVDRVKSVYPTLTLFADKENVSIDVEYNRDANKVIDELLGLIVGKTFVTDVEILANKWVGTSSPYSQVVTVAGASKRSQVDLTPSAEQLAIFHSKDLAFVTENDNGVITVYAIGQKPANDYTIQATVTEVNV